MAFTLLESSKLSRNLLWQGIAQSIVETDELAALIPFAPFAGQAITYQREATLPSTGFIPDAGTMAAASTGTDTLVSVPVRAIAGDLDVNSLADDLSQGADKGRQVVKKAKATWELVKDTIITGGNVTSHTLGSVADPFAAIGTAGVGGISYGPWLDSGRFGPGEIKYVHSTTSWYFRAPGDPDFGAAVVAATDGVYVLKSFNEAKWIAVTLDVSDATANGRTSIEFTSSTNAFDGLNRICASSMVRASGGADGDAFSFQILDELLNTQKVRNRRAFIMNGSISVRMLNHLRSLGGANPDHLALPGYAGPTLSYRGVPILICDNIPSTETKGARSNLSSIYLAAMDADEGLFMGVPSRTQTLDVEADPRTTPVMGFKIEDIGELEAVAHRRVRVKWYGALGLRSERALVRASEIQTTA